MCRDKKVEDTEKKVLMIIVIAILVLTYITLYPSIEKIFKHYDTTLIAVFKGVK